MCPANPAAKISPGPFPRDDLEIPRPAKKNAGGVGEKAAKINLANGTFIQNRLTARERERELSTPLSKNRQHCKSREVREKEGSPGGKLSHAEFQVQTGRKDRET